MLAILNSWGTKPTTAIPLRGNFKLLAATLGLLVTLLALPTLTRAGDDPLNSSRMVPSLGQQPAFAELAQKAFDAAKARHQAQPTNNEAAWQFGRACYDLADFATSNTQRENLAQQGIAACQELIGRDPNSARGHYYLALNLGQLARTRKLGALKLVGEMEPEFKTVVTLDPQLDYGGADRGLGLLYMEAPGWPLSIGSKSKARQHLQKAEKISPNFPENLLNLIEAHLKWGDRNAAIRELKTLDEIWPGAQKEFAGEQWASSWADWTARRDMFRKKVLIQPSRTSAHD